MIAFISSFGVINIVMLDPKMFLIAVFVADVAAVNCNGVKPHLPNVLSAFFIKEKPVFSNDSKNLPKNTPDWYILRN